MLPLDDGVRFAARRAELTQAAADAHPGRMAALLGATVEQAEDACTRGARRVLGRERQRAGQVVIAGTPDGVEAGSARAKELGVKRATPLNVGGAFHTPLMRDAADGLVAELATVHVRRTASRRSSRTTTRRAYDDADGWRERLRRARHASRCGGARRWRRWSPSAPTSFLEVGHGSMIAGLAKRTVPDIARPRRRHPRRRSTTSWRGSLMEALLDHGEGLLVPERMIVAPTVGMFRPVDLDATARTLTRGQTVGMVDGPGTSTPVASPFAGQLVGHARAPR